MVKQRFRIEWLPLMLFLIAGGIVFLVTSLLQFDIQRAEFAQDCRDRGGIPVRDLGGVSCAAPLIDE